MLNAFLTGSHAYGTPHAESDIDLVLLMDSNEYNKFVGLLEDDELQGESGGHVIRFGRLNLIVVFDVLAFSSLKEATENLILKKPVIREEACIEICRVRNENIDKHIDNLSVQESSSRRLQNLEFAYKTANECLDTIFGLPGKDGILPKEFVKLGEDRFQTLITLAKAYMLEIPRLQRRINYLEQTYLEKRD